MALKLHPLFVQESMHIVTVVMPRLRMRSEVYGSVCVCVCVWTATAAL